MKAGKALALDGFAVKCLLKGGMTVLLWLVRIEPSFDTRAVHTDWRDAYITSVSVQS